LPIGNGRHRNLGMVYEEKNAFILNVIASFQVTVPALSRPINPC
jgi:hypothetical protein